MENGVFALCKAEQNIKLLLIVYNHTIDCRKQGG